MAEPKRPRIDFTAQERRTEMNLLKDLKNAEKFAAVNPEAVAVAKAHLAELYAIVEDRYRNEK